MKHFKSIIIVFVTTLIFGCSNGSAQEENNQSSKESTSNEETLEELFQKSMQGIEATKYNEYIDPNNSLAQARYPIPKSWKVNDINNPIYVEGPNNLRVYKSELESLAWSDNPMMQQTLQMNGKTLAQPMGNK